MLCKVAHISSSTSLAWTRRYTPRLMTQSLLGVEENNANRHHCSVRRSSTATTRLPPRSCGGSSHHKLERRHFQSSACTNNSIYPCKLSLLKSLGTTTNLTNPTKPTAATTTIRCNSADTESTDEPKKATVKKPKKFTTLSVAAKKRRGQKLTMVTAYDYPSAVHVDRAGIDIVLVGDSCAMVELGFETTQVCCSYFLLILC